MLLILAFTCAFQKDILLQGRMYLSLHHISFNSNIFGWITNVVIPFSDVLAIEKKVTAFVIPNAIQITTLHSKYFFASFISRDATFSKIVESWKNSIAPAKESTPSEIYGGTEMETVFGEDEIFLPYNADLKVAATEAVVFSADLNGTCGCKKHFFHQLFCICVPITPCLLFKALFDNNTTFIKAFLISFNMKRIKRI